MVKATKEATEKKAPSARAQKMAERKAREEQARVDEWMALGATWEARTAKVLDYFMDKEPGYYSIKVEQPARYAGCVCMRLQSKENDWQLRQLYMNFPGDRIPMDETWESLSELERLEEHMAEIEAAKSEASRKERVRKEALEKVKAILNDEELELLRIR